MPLSASAKRIQDLLYQRGFSYQVQELPQTTRTAAEAAQAVGCSVAQIAKSIVFRAAESNRPILVIASGRNRVSEEALAQLVTEPIDKADAEFVREQTGFVIGGVPPLGHSEPLETYIDEDLLSYEQIWAAAGTPHAVFCLTPADLVLMTEGQVISIR